jgi:hypothetical protein
MEGHEGRELLVIEQNLLADAPELAELFDRLAEPRQHEPDRRAPRLLAAILLLGALVLVAMSVIRGMKHSYGPR